MKRRPKERSILEYFYESPINSAKAKESVYFFFELLELKYSFHTIE